MIVRVIRNRSQLGLQIRETRETHDTCVFHETHVSCVLSWVYIERTNGERTGESNLIRSNFGKINIYKMNRQRTYALYLLFVVHYLLSARLICTYLWKITVRSSFVRLRSLSVYPALRVRIWSQKLSAVRITAGTRIVLDPNEYRSPNENYFIIVFWETFKLSYRNI